MTNRPAISSDGNGGRTLAELVDDIARLDDTFAGWEPEQRAGIAAYKRAIEAYDEALKVRTGERTPLEYAITIANKANCLWNLPDDPMRPERGGAQNLTRARAYYAEAREIFVAHGAREKAQSAARACDQIDREILAGAEPSRGAELS